MDTVDVLRRIRKMEEKMESALHKANRELEATLREAREEAKTRLDQGMAEVQDAERKATAEANEAIAAEKTRILSEGNTAAEQSVVGARGRVDNAVDFLLNRFKDQVNNL